MCHWPPSKPGPSTRQSERLVQSCGTYHSVQCLRPPLALCLRLDLYHGCPGILGSQKKAEATLTSSRTFSSCPVVAFAHHSGGHSPRAEALLQPRQHLKRGGLEARGVAETSPPSRSNRDFEGQLHKPQGAFQGPRNTTACASPKHCFLPTRARCYILKRQDDTKLEIGEIVHYKLESPMWRPSSPHPSEQGCFLLSNG